MTKELMKYSLEELENEVKHRKELIEEEERRKKYVEFSEEVQNMTKAFLMYNEGKPKKDQFTCKNFAAFLSTCKDLVEQIKDLGDCSVDDSEYIFEAAMKFVYGENFFTDFYNKYF